MLKWVGTILASLCCTVLVLPSGWCCWLVELECGHCKSAMGRQNAAKPEERPCCCHTAASSKPDDKAPGQPLKTQCPRCWRETLKPAHVVHEDGAGTFAYLISPICSQEYSPSSEGTERQVPVHGPPLLHVLLCIWRC
jgi:hypothetical protein